MMRLKANMMIYAYWSALRSDSRPPLREHFNPMALGPHLPNIFMLSSIASRLPFFRLAGTGLYDRFRKEMRGFPFPALWKDSAQQDSINIARRTILQGDGTVLSATATSYDGSRCGLFEMLLLPLRTANPDEFRILGTLLPEFDDDAGICAPLAYLQIDGYALVSQDSRLRA